ncbi:DUF2330 domain-containing protein [Haliangium ochraceum]|uniref:DUF2330 domain-containing protein n=1 Tax=Haliangium ochraceum (strain DSM 14365 / JCM 11303 / SMP-2) TaxID=502025 RepID=D0LV18_HALO1|nr:DUF2330 domain-containing protein [Haliangium ochraceum]ACY15859.1 conserved hypothetical protein [Haliangium ochraceum DSM 14365]
MSLSARPLIAASLGLAGALALGAASGLTPVPAAHACGCFAPPDPSVPVVQGGERILFAMNDGVVTAHVQIQYNGAADEFAWLVPLPAEPTLGVGTDELFTRIIAATQPTYQVTTNIPEQCTSPVAAPGRGGLDAGVDFEDGGDVLVSRDLVGPFETAVLRADDKQPMLDWLSENRFFVPAGTDEAVDPYIKEGAYFLALKLSAGNDAGDMQPIVISYASELPQIPIVLTSVAADPDMPVLVWVLGEHRAIPRNFFHTEINDARIDWLGNGSNYVAVVTEAVDEADGHHSFITEYAGPSTPMLDVLDPEGRFGDLDELRQLSEPVQFIGYLGEYGYTQTTPFGGAVLSTQLVSLLQVHLPLPQELIDEVESERGYTLTEAEFYGSFQYYSETYADIVGPAHADFDPAALTALLDERIVAPTLAAGQLFRDNPYLTRLFTTLSPEEMTKDPVFSFNPDLDEVSKDHRGTLELLECSEFGGANFSGPAILTTEQGRRLYLPDGLADSGWITAPLPASLRIEMLREEGAPEVVTDNEAAIASGIDEYRAIPEPKSDDGGCSARSGAAPGAGALLLGGFVLLALRRRRRA